MAAPGVGALDPVSLTRRVKAALYDTVGIPPDAGLAPEGGPTPSPELIAEQGSGAWYRFKYGGVEYKVDLLQLSALFSVGKITLVQMFDPAINPHVELTGLDPTVRAWILSQGLLRAPGRYEFIPNLAADASPLMDYIFASDQPGNFNGQTPGGGPFGAGNAVKTFYTRAIPSTAFQNLTFHFDNEAGIDGTFSVLASYSQNGSFGTYASGAAPQGGDTPAGVDLTAAVIPYLKGQIVFAGPPTSGFVRIVPVGRR